MYILLVDDSSVMRKMAKIKLTYRHKLYIVEAENGKEALDLVKREKPGFIITDVNMPVMDGFEFITEVRKIYDKLELPIIAYTSDPSNIEKCIELGCNQAILKPIDIMALKDAIHSFAQKDPKYEAIKHKA